MSVETDRPEPSLSASAARELVGVQVLVVDQDRDVQQGLAQLLAEAGLHVTSAFEPTEAIARIDSQFFSVALVDVDTPTPGAGLATIAEVKRRSPTTMVLALTPRRSWDDAVAAIRAGAIDLILKAPESVPYLHERVLAAAGRSVGHREVDAVLADVRDVYDDFLQRFMDAERRAADLGDRLAGKDPTRTAQVDELRVLIVDEVEALYEAMTSAAPPGFSFVHATSGGEALDRAGGGQFHYAMIAEDLTDLPVSMVVRSLRTQAPELVLLTFLGPADNGRVGLVDSSGTRPVVPRFTDAAQLVERLDELAEAWRAKARERRYMQAFREKHYDFLRRYVELRTKIQRTGR
ncbi:MAG: response regulator [Kofleriaceae bacterium]|nr:response regulator [Kofleriaceae bacterium]MBP9204102.1 response regulator [Kofleriaceae bacterium]